MAPIRVHPAISLPEEYKPAKVALAYSGGLASTCLIPWLKARYDCEVIAVVADVGQPEDLSGVEARALASGASACYVLDLRHELMSEYILPTLRAGAISDRKYRLGPAMAGTLIAQHQVEIALRHGCDALAHGCAGDGSEQTQYELSYQALAPMLRVIAPRQLWEVRSREDAIAYAMVHDVPVARASTTARGSEGSLWHRTVAGGPQGDPWRQPPGDGHRESGTPAAAADTTVTITFERGTPVAIDGRQRDMVALVTELNELGSAYGVGRVDLVEPRLDGKASHGSYETPGGSLLMTAHRELEHLTLDKATMRLKDLLAQIYADVVYNGQWFSPLREALDAFVVKTQEPVSGDVRLKLDNRRCFAVGRRSPFGLSEEEPTTYGADDVYRQADAEGLIRLFGLGQNMAAQRDRRLRGQDVELVK